MNFYEDYDDDCYIISEDLGLEKKIDKLENYVEKAIEKSREFSPTTAEEKRINSYLKKRLPEMLKDADELRKVNAMSDEEIEGSGYSVKAAKKKLKNTIKRYKEFSKYCNDSTTKVIVKKIIGSLLWTMLSGIGGIISAIMGFKVVKRKISHDKEGIEKIDKVKFLKEEVNYFPY